MNSRSFFLVLALGAGGLTKPTANPASADVDCGGKHSATPLWPCLRQVVAPREDAIGQSGVALLLPPQSIRTLSIPLGCQTGKAAVLLLPRRVLQLAVCSSFVLRGQLGPRNVSVSGKR